MSISIANYVKFQRGNKEAFKKLKHKDNDTLYFVYEEDELIGDLYLGSKLIAGANEIGEASVLSALKDVDIRHIENKDFLVFDMVSSKWINKPVKDILEDFVGANASANGISGLVPAPEAGKTGLFLRSDGRWAKVISFDIDDVRELINTSELHQQEKIDQTNSKVIVLENEIVELDDKVFADGGLESRIASLETNIGSISADFNQKINTTYSNFDDRIKEVDNNFISKINTITINHQEDIDRLDKKYLSLEEKVINDNQVLKTNIDNLDSKFETEKTLLESSIATKIDFEEANEIIKQEVVKLDHLERKIVSAIEAVDLFAIDAEKYIYMIPNSTTGNYDEYLITNGELERVGEWTNELITSINSNQMSVTFGKLNIDKIDISVVEGLQNIIFQLTSRIDELEKQLNK